MSNFDDDIVLHSEVMPIDDGYANIDHEAERRYLAPEKSELELE